MSVVVTVDPLPIGTPVASGTYESCSGETLSIVPAADIGLTTFVWSGDNGSGGSGNITDAPVNATNAPFDVTYTVTPTSPGPNSCVGADFDIVVTVNPAPVMSATNNAAVLCSGASTDIDLNSPTAGHQIELTG